MIRAPINPELLRWARERSGMKQKDLIMKFKNLSEWESGEKQPTLKQLESFARTVYVPFDYLFLRVHPKECLPIADIRTISSCS